MLNLINPTQIMHPIPIPSQQLQIGMSVINIGKISFIELCPTAQLIRFKCEEESILSCAYFWFRYNTTIYIC